MAMSQLTARLATGLLLGPLVVALIMFAPIWISFSFMLLVSIASAHEMGLLVRLSAPQAATAWLPVLIVLFGLPLFWLQLHPSGADPAQIVLAFATALLLLAGAFSLCRVRDFTQSLLAVGVLCFGVPYFVLTPLAVIEVRLIDPWLVFLLFAIVWLGDSAAYFIGSAFGRHKITPNISPNKSWEGAIASTMTALACSVVWSLVRWQELSLPLLAVTLVVSVVAQAGDLLESQFKRGAGVKDSATVIPGHGGFYDRMDAMLLAAPVFALGLFVLRLCDVLPEGGS